MGFPVLNEMTLNCQISLSAADSVELVTTADGSYEPAVTPGTIALVERAPIGTLELIRLRVPAATLVTIPVGTTWTWDYRYQAQLVTDDEANVGLPVGFSAHPITVDPTYDQYAWFVIGGSWPVYCEINLPAGSQLGIMDDGVCGMICGGLQIEHAYVSAASSYTKAYNAYTKKGSPTILINNEAHGWFVGAIVSGSVIPTLDENEQTVTARIADIAPDNRTVTLDTAVTGSGINTITAAYTDGDTLFWNLATFDRPHLQGADAVAPP